MRNEQMMQRDIQRVMSETGMDYMQALRHVQGKDLLQQTLQRKRDPYPLGKSAVFEV